MYSAPSQKLEEGFTLVELLTVIIIIGILAAIGLPSFLNHTSKAHHTEAKKNIATVIRAQQLLYSETAKFTNRFDDLALGHLKGNNTTSSKAYDYQIAVTNGSTSSLATITAASRAADFKSYSGASEVDNSVPGRVSWNSIICGSLSVAEPAAAPTNVTTCPANYKRLSAND
jgi:type IV pilus assembly protein PilA